MSTFKKVVSLMLCFVMLFGTVAVAGTAFVEPKAAATETVATSKIKSYADLDAAYDNFIYLGLEFYEEETPGTWTLTDYYVDPGQSLKMYFYVKTDMYLGAGNPYVIFERSFFDVTNGATNLTYDTSYDPNKTDYPTKGYPANFNGTMNPAHSSVAAAGVTVTMSTNWCRNVNGFKKLAQVNWHGVDLSESDTWDIVFGSWTRDGTDVTSWEAKDDAYYYEYTLKVREYQVDGTTPLADGTTGFVKMDHRFFKKYDAATATSKRVADIKVATDSATTFDKMLVGNKATFYTIDDILIDDCNHTFTIGEPVTVKSHSATFMVDGEAYGDALTVNEGAEIAAPAENPSKTGYTFKGWALENSSEVLTFPQTMGEADVVYVAVFEELPAQTATFYVDGEEFDTFEIYAGGKIVAPTAPAGENGRTFLHWSTSADEDIEVTDWTMPEGGAAFYAVYTEAATHTVTYYVNDAVCETVTVIEDSTFELAAAPEYDATAYRFLGWSTVKDDAAEIVSGTQLMGSSDLSYYAVFEEIVYYTVTYYNDGVVYGTPADYEENTSYTVIADTLTKTGYTFLGWSTVENNADAIVSGEQNIGTADVNLYAVYSVNNYNVTFNANGGSFADGTTVTESLAFGTEIVAPAAPARTGYTFAGWAARTNGTALDSLGTVGAADTTFYALWTANTYKVTFYADAEGTTVLYTKDATYGKALIADANKAPTAPEGKEHDGWKDADGNLYAKNNLGTFTKTADLKLYPTFSDYPCSITVIAKNFVTGEEKVVGKVYGKENGTAYTATAFASFRDGLDNNATYGWDGDVYYDPATASAKIGTDEATATTIGRNETIKFNGHQTIWLQAEPVFTVEYNVPVFDETAGEYKDEYTTFTATTRLSVSNNVLVPVSAVVPADGYTFLGWYTEDGAKANYSSATSNFLFPVALENGANITVYAEFELKTYNLLFYVGNETDSMAQVVIKGGFKVGETVDLDEAEFVYITPASIAGQTAYIPVPGLENSEQPIRFNGKDGFKFIGYYFGNDNTKEIVEIDGLVITEEIIEKYADKDGSDYIRIGATWEAQAYKATFRYETSDSTAENPKYETIEVMATVNTALDEFNPYKDATVKATIDAATPEGLKFSRWSYDTSITDNGKMVAGGVTYTAVYTKVQYTVYVDYNNGGEPQSLDTVAHGDDTMAVGDEFGEGRGIYYVVKTIQLDAYRPTETHESIGWKAYHVHDEADVNDPSKWIEGVNCDGTNEAKATIIYKNEWKQHGEFLVSLYGTDGKIYCALGKNFKMYYWETRRACSKDEATLVHNPELIILFLSPEFEKDDSGISLKLTPFALNRSLFTFSNIGALFEAIGTLLGSLIRGEL